MGHPGFEIKEPGQVTLEIHNITGQKVITLINTELQAGFHTITWDGKSKAGTSVATGLYLYKLSFNGDVKTRKMVMLK
jgi:flagellar hook assembly protein FlgD